MDSATEDVMPMPHTRAVYSTVLWGNLTTKLHVLSEIPHLPIAILPRLTLAIYVCPQTVHAVALVR